MVMATATMADIATWLLVGKICDSGVIQHIPLNTFPFQVGRLPGMPLCLPLPEISKRHAEIDQRDGCLFLRDLGSTNGTYVGGNKVLQEIRLSENDVVQFATQGFRVQRER